MQEQQTHVLLASATQQTLHCHHAWRVHCGATAAALQPLIAVVCALPCLPACRTVPSMTGATTSAAASSARWAGLSAPSGRRACRKPSTGERARGFQQQGAAGARSDLCALGQVIGTGSAVLFAPMLCCMAGPFCRPGDLYAVVALQQRLPSKLELLPRLPQNCILRGWVRVQVHEDKV